MTENEIRFLVTQWGQNLATAVITDTAQNVTKTPNDSIILAVALKHVNRRIDDLITTIKTLESNNKTAGFDAITFDTPKSST